MIRVGLLGLGIHGRRYAHHLLSNHVPGLVLTGCWTRSASTYERLGSHEVVRFDSPEALLESPQVDALVFALPFHVQFPLLLRALELKRPVLAEKPVALSRSQADRLLQLGAQLSVAHTLRFDPLLQRLSQEVGSEALGKALGFSFSQRLEPRPVAWEKRRDEAGGGVVAQSAVHTLDAVRFVLGPAELRIEQARLRSVHASEVEDQADILLSHDTVAGTVAASKLGTSRHHRFSVILEHGGVEADFIDRRLWITRGRERTSLPVPPEPTLVGLLTGFGAYLRNEGPNPVAAAEGRAAAAAIEDIYRLAARAKGE